MLERGSGIRHDIDGMRLAENPRERNPEPRCRTSRDFAGRILCELPIGIVHLDLGDRHGLGAAAAHEKTNSIAVEYHPLESEVLDRRRPAAEVPQWVGKIEPRCGEAEHEKRYGD